MNEFEEVKVTVNEIEVIRGYIYDNDYIDPEFVIRVLDLIPENIEIEETTDILIKEAIQKMTKEVGRLLKLEEGIRMKKLNITK